MARTLLVTDDALIIREIIKDAAMSAGWQIVGEAADGQQAVESYRRLRPDVCTLDLVMPEFDGLYALRGIMSLDPGARVLVVSALEQKNTLKEAFSAGAYEFLVKPFKAQALVDTINRMVPETSAHAAV